MVFEEALNRFDVVPFAIVMQRCERAWHAWRCVVGIHAGQDASALEPLEVVRMEGQYRRARRRAQNAGRAHDRPDETVEERRLPRPCRAADDDEGRRVHLREARELRKNPAT